MGQEVKNPLRAQSKYGLMGSSTKTGKKFFRGSPEHFLHENAIWYRTPPTYTSIAVYMCAGGFRVPNLQTEFNYLDLFKSYGIFSDFIVPMVSTLSPSSLCHPCHPHIVPIAPRRSPCCPHGLWSPWSVVSTCLRGLHMLSPWSPHHPRHPHIVPIAPRRSLCGPHGLWSPWSPHVVPMVSTCCPRHPHVIPMSSPSSPHHLEGPHIIPNPPDTHSTHPSPGWGPRISKNTIRFELIEIF